MKLYEIADEFRRIDDALTENGGEVTEELQAALDGLEYSLEGKVDAIAGLIREAQARAAAFSTEAVRLREKAQAEQNRAESLHGYLLTHLKAIGKDKVKGQIFSVSVRTASIPSITWDGEGSPPRDFQRVKVELDGKKAQDALRSGTLPDGFNVRYTTFLQLR